MRSKMLEHEILIQKIPYEERYLFSIIEMFHALFLIRIVALDRGTIAVVQ